MAIARKGKLLVEISNVTTEQASEFVRLFGWMNQLGNLGCSRGAHVSYDGDGNARAIILVNGEKAMFSKSSWAEEDVYRPTFFFE